MPNNLTPEERATMLISAMQVTTALEYEFGNKLSQYEKQRGHRFTIPEIALGLAMYMATRGGAGVKMAKCTVGDLYGLLSMKHEHARLAMRGLGVNAEEALEEFNRQFDGLDLTVFHDDVTPQDREQARNEAYAALYDIIQGKNDD